VSIYRADNNGNITYRAPCSTTSTYAHKLSRLHNYKKLQKVSIRLFLFCVTKER
jgi:hypothetical protein